MFLHTVSSWIWRSVKASVRFLFSDSSLVYSASLALRVVSTFLHWINAFARSLSFFWYLIGDKSQRLCQPEEEKQVVLSLDLLHIRSNHPHFFQETYVNRIQ